MGWALIGIYIFCIIYTFSAFTDHQNETKDRIKKRKLNQKIVQNQQQQLKQIISQKKSFQSYHFQLDSQQRSIQFYLDTEVNDQLRAYVKVLWKYRNAYVLPSALKLQRVQLKIYENQIQMETEKFYTKGGLTMNFLKDNIYKVVISHKSNAKVSKLITLNVGHYFQSFQYINSKLGHFKDKAKRMSKTANKMAREPVQNEQDSPSQEISSQGIQNQPFDLSLMQERVEQLLNQTKLLINEAQTKHLAEYSVQKYIDDSIQVYWVYQIFQCLIVVACAIVQILLIHKIFEQNKIDPLI